MHAELCKRERVIAVVVARAGSKGVRGKNTASVAGKPCVAWTIEHAKDAPFLEDVVVSSDSPEILGLAGEMGVRAHQRSDSLASDTARVDDALREAVGWWEGARADGAKEPRHATEIDGVVLLYGNVPVRPAGLVARAVSLWQETGCDSVQSYVGVGKHHPWWQVRIEADGRVKPWQGDRLFGGVYRRQELPPSLVPDGGVVVVSRRALFHEIAGLDPSHPHAFLGRDHRAIVNEEGSVIDIDAPLDLVVAGAVLGERHAHR
ncbi:MAG: acylneuraminate cytidylyltransferase family protein [Planctomycetota bacterium]|nr:acylneuraminate cytidylyltransferase family protein [Planctomycetota bacterium]